MRKVSLCLFLLALTPFLLAQVKNTLGAQEERISVRKCREYKEFYRETFAPKFSGRDPILGKYKCPQNRRIKHPNLRRDVLHHEFPHTAALWYEADVNGTRTGYKFRCSGTLISKRHVLVPGHCIYSKWGKPTHVTFGDADLYHQGPNSRRQVLQVADIIFHPNYVPPSSVDDIAIIQLAKAVKFDKRSRTPRPTVRPACLAVEGQEILYGLSLTAYEADTGMLRTERVTLIPKNKECEVTLRIQHKDNFSLRFGEQVRGSQFCSESLASGTCLTDIGASLTTQPVRGMPCVDYVYGLLAVNTTGGCKGGKAYPLVYTKIEKYLDWIEQVVWPKLFKSGLAPSYLGANTTYWDSSEIRR